MSEGEAVALAVTLDRLNRSYDALRQIRLAMPMLKELLSPYDAVVGDPEEGARSIRLAALVDATVNLIDQTLEEED